MDGLVADDHPLLRSAPTKTQNSPIKRLTQRTSTDQLYNLKIHDAAPQSLELAPRTDQPFLSSLHRVSDATFVHFPNHARIHQTFTRETSEQSFRYIQRRLIVGRFSTAQTGGAVLFEVCQLALFELEGGASSAAAIFESSADP